jgi:hypothetical protein
VHSLAIKLVLGTMVALLIAIFVFDRIRRKHRWAKIAERLGLSPQREGSAGLAAARGVHAGREVAIEHTEHRSLAQTHVRVGLKTNLTLGLFASSVPWTTTYANSGIALAFYAELGKGLAGLIEPDADRIELADKKLARLFQCTATDRRASLIVDDANVTRALVKLRRPRTGVLLSDRALEIAVRGHIFSERKLRELLDELGRACDAVERAHQGAGL